MQVREIAGNAITAILIMLFREFAWNENIKGMDKDLIPVEVIKSFCNEITQGKIKRTRGITATEVNGRNQIINGECFIRPSSVPIK